MPAVAQSFGLLLLPINVSDYVATGVANDLPGLQRSRAPAAALAGDPILAAMQLLAENMGGGGGRGAREPKGGLVVYRETHRVLQRYCHVVTIDRLAPLWNRDTRGGKGEQQSILRQELTRVCTGRGLTPNVYCPVITTGLKQWLLI